MKHYFVPSLISMFIMPRGRIELPSLSLSLSSLPKNCRCSRTPTTICTLSHARKEMEISGWRKYSSLGYANFSSELLAKLILVTPVLRASSRTAYLIWTSTHWQQRVSSPCPLSCWDEENVVWPSPCTTPRQFTTLPSRIRTTLVPKRCI